MSRYILKTKTSTRTGNPSVPLGGGANGGSGPVGAGAVADAGDRRMSEFSSMNDVCPICKSDRYLNPKLRLLVSRCYHKMCESCIDRIFSLGPEPCPVCHQILRKAHFTPQSFEDLNVQKEVVIRQRIARCFNKVQEDFISLRAYNDYLEEVEDIMFNLINAVDVATTEAKILAYQTENRELIASNLTRQEREAAQMKHKDDEEMREKEDAKLAYEQMDEEDRLARETERAAVLSDLESSTASTRSVLSAARTSALRRSTARSLAPAPPSRSSLRFLANLADPTRFEEVDILADLKDWDAYEGLYKIKVEGYGGVQEEKTVGGGIRSEMWEKAIRAGVAGLFIMPLA